MKADAKYTTSIFPAFPVHLLRAGLDNFFNQIVKDRAKDPFKPKGTVHELVPAIDSLTVARSLNVAAKILKCKVPANTVKRGGYANRMQMIDDLLPKLEVLYKKRSTSTKF